MMKKMKKMKKRCRNLQGKLRMQSFLLKTEYILLTYNFNQNRGGGPPISYYSLKPIFVGLSGVNPCSELPLSSISLPGSISSIVLTNVCLTLSTVSYSACDIEQSIMKRKIARTIIERNTIEQVTITMI
jgi:hypothetical protein